MEATTSTAQDEQHAELLVHLATWEDQPMPKVGIAGVGGVATYAHAPAYRRLGFPVTVLYDADQGAITRCRDALGTDNESALNISDADALWDHLPGLDFLDICLPTPAHAPFITTLFDRLGGDCPALLVQKPLADAELAEQIVTRAEDLGVRIAVNLTARWVPPFARLRDIVRGGTAGETSTVSVLNRGWNPKNGVDWRSRLPRLIAFEMAVHYIDLLIWTYGAPRTVYAALQNVSGQGVRGDNVAFLTLVFDNGLKASITQDWTCRDTTASHFHPEHEQIIVSGSKATLVATPHRLRVTEDHRQTRTFSSRASWFPDAFAGPPAEFAYAIRHQRPSPLDAANHLPVLRVIDACYQSALTNTVVEVKQ